MRQEDAAECWQHLLMLLDKEFAVPTRDVLEMTEAYVMQCASCGHMTHASASNDKLAVPVATTNANNIEVTITTFANTLRIHTAEEALEVTECGKCRAKGHVSRASCFVKMPPVLFLHFKRHKFLQHLQTKYGHNVQFDAQALNFNDHISSEASIATHVDHVNALIEKDGAAGVAAALNRENTPMIPPRDAATSSSCVYKASAVIKHHGDDFNVGHYTASVRLGTTAVLSANDEYVSGTTWLDSIPDAYILVLVRDTHALIAQLPDPRDVPLSPPSKRMKTKTASEILSSLLQDSPST